MRLYKCDRCKKEINEDDVCEIKGFTVDHDFCEECADEWDTLMLTVKDAFLKQQTIWIHDGKEEKKDCSTCKYECNKLDGYRPCSLCDNHDKWEKWEAKDE